MIDRRICVAPMMDYTDRHCRYLLRLLSPRSLLYTEMVTAHARVHGHLDRLLGFDHLEHHVALLKERRGRRERLTGGQCAALVEDPRVADRAAGNRHAVDARSR